MKNLLHGSRHLSSSQIIIFGFLSVILTGCLLLMLPLSTVDKKGADFMDALFTAVSATCVTGLVVHDTSIYWSGFGQLVILFLIQIGGMGVITAAVAVALISGRRIGLMQRSMMQETIAAPSVGGIVRLTGFIIKTTLCVEMAGALLMLPVFGREFGWAKGSWYAVFHSVSAFCNAGFDLLGETKQYSSLTAYSGRPVINAVVMALIIIGGIGFLTWDDVRSKGIHIKKYRMQSKVILIMTSILIILPALFFYTFEFSSPAWNGMTEGEKLWSSFFQSVTPRTAGFNTVELSAFSEAGKTILILLMLIGGSPGSTAGGMKTTTLAVLFMTLFAVFRRKEDTDCCGRRIAGETIRNAATIMLMYLVLFLLGGIIISCLEGLPMLTCLFETASAIGTVGLSLGVTPELGMVSRGILILLMFLGRVGGLTLVFAAVSGTHTNMLRLPKEKITVG